MVIRLKEEHIDKPSRVKSNFYFFLRDRQIEIAPLVFKIQTPY